MGRTILFICIFLTVRVFAETATPTIPIQDESITTDHTVTIAGKNIPYKATAGTLVLNSAEDKPLASIFFISYSRSDSEKNNNRPVFFCFNGGPGVSSVWLNLGIMGPKRVVFNKENPFTPPYELVDNEYSLLDAVDLVFIDAMSTGYSRPAPGEDAKQFYGVDEDIRIMGEFIRKYCSKYEKWNSPKYLIGESYGTTRVAGLGAYLRNRDWFNVNGIVLISSILNWLTVFDNPEGGNDLPYILSLPSYTGTAWYHKKLPPELQGSLDKALQESKDFALNKYAKALLYGDSLPEEEKKEVVKGLSRLTGISEENILKKEMRLELPAFRELLLEKEKQVIGRFDCRMVGEVPPFCDMSCPEEFDPTVESILGLYTASINNYLQKDLKWEKDMTYVMFASVQPWKFTRGPTDLFFLNLAPALSNSLCKNPKLKVFVASGLFDLATPFFATEYTFNHMALTPSMKSRITKKEYEGGHMMYLDVNILSKMRQDILQFVQDK